MQVFVLNMDRSVTVEYIPGDSADYVAACVPKGQVFYKDSSFWRCLHRSGHCRDNKLWAASKVPDEIKLAYMLVN